MMCGFWSVLRAKAYQAWRRAGLLALGWLVMLATYGVQAQETTLQTAQTPAPIDTAGAASVTLPSAAQLADFLEDETTRKALIERLREVSVQEKTPPAVQTLQGDGLTQWVAARTQALLDDAANRVGGAAQAFRDLGSMGMRSIALERWLPILGAFALVALVGRNGE